MLRTGRTEDKGRRCSFLSCLPFRSFLPFFLLCSAAPTFICCHSYSVGGAWLCTFFSPLRSDSLLVLPLTPPPRLTIRPSLFQCRATLKQPCCYFFLLLYSPHPTPPSLRAAHGGSIYGVRPGLREPVLPDSSPNRSDLVSPASRVVGGTRVCFLTRMNPAVAASSRGAGPAWLLLLVVSGPGCLRVMTDLNERYRH